jgi:chromosome segregation ATPase
LCLIIWIERENKKLQKDKLKLGLEIQELKDKLSTFNAMHNELTHSQLEIRKLYEQKNELQDQIYKLKDKKGDLEEAKLDIKLLQNEIKNWEEKEKLYLKEVEILKAAHSSGSSEITEKIEILERDKTIMQLELDLANTKLELKEKQEESQKLKSEYSEISSGIDKLKENNDKEMLKEKEHMEAFIKTCSVQMREIKRQHEREMRVLTLALSDIGFDAYKDKQSLKSD